MNMLANAVLPWIRSGADLHYRAANAHGRDMHEAIDHLEAAIPSGDPAEVHAVTHKALASALKVIARADDSSGIMGDACRRLLELHPRTAVAAQVPPGKLVDWMMKFQFEGDYFELDPVAYAPALGDAGMATYRARLAALEESLGEKPSADARWSSGRGHDWFTLEWNAKRLAVLDHDIDAIIRTHARDRRVAAWFEDTAKAFEEVGEFDLAIDWAKQATEFKGGGHQSLKAADYWCRLLEEHRTDDVLAARLDVFRRWPTSRTADQFHTAAGATWPKHRDEVLAALSTRPDQAVGFALSTLKDPRFAWELAHSLDLESDHTWSELAKAYEKVDPIAVLPVHHRLVETELVTAGVENYRRAARRLATMRKLASGSPHAHTVDEFIGALREVHRRRPRLQQEFDRARLP